MTNKANFGQRLIAELIDYTLAWSIFFWFVYQITKTTDLQLILGYILSWVVANIWYWALLYFLQAYLISQFGASIGKLLTGLKIVTSDGKYLTFWKAFFRELGLKPISYYFLGLGFWWMIKDQDKQTWHDKALDTYVVVNNSAQVLLGGLILASLLGLQVFAVTQIIPNTQANLPAYQEMMRELFSEPEITTTRPKTQNEMDLENSQEAQMQQLERQLQLLQEMEKNQKVRN